MEYMFRTLRADEIDVRVATVSEKGCSLLLYKDARCDMNILDETVGSRNWQRSHELINGNLFCNVGICFEENSNGYINHNWVWKQDVGVESYTEKEKGEASDSFKRACFNWGIGRELYTAPFMRVTEFERKQKNGKIVCNDRFSVSEIEYTDRKISKLVIVNKSGDVVYTYGMGNEKQKSEEKSQPIKENDYQVLDEVRADMYEIGNKSGFNNDEITKIALAKFKSKPMVLSIEQLKLLKEQFMNNGEALRKWLNAKT